MLTREHGIFDARGWPDRLEQGRHGHYVALAERMLETYRAGTGKARLDLHGEVERIFADVAECPPKRVAAFCKLLDDVSEYDEDSRGKAAKLRKEVFRLAAPRHPLVAAKDSLFENEEAAVKADVAKALGKAWPDIERSLFLDVIEYHRLKSFSGYRDGRALLSRYNVAQWQVRLYDATAMVVRARNDLKTIVRHAKLAGLMHSVEMDPATGEHVLTFDGPASVLRETRRYGVNMAMFLPTLAACGGWRMTADIRRNRGGFATRLELKAGHLKVDSPPPEPFDSSVEAAFFKKWAGEEREGWRLSREDVILEKGQKVFIPDFTLRHSTGAEVLLEIVGFWTPEYMARKAKTLRLFRDSRLLLAVAEQVGDMLPKDTGPTVTYKSGLKIKDVLAALGRIGRYWRDELDLVADSFMTGLGTVEQAWKSSGEPLGKADIARFEEITGYIAFTFLSGDLGKDGPK